MMKIVIFIPQQPAPVEPIYRMRFLIKLGVQVIDRHNVDVHNTLAGSGQIDCSMVEREAT